MKSKRLKARTVDACRRAFACLLFGWLLLGLGSTVFAQWKIDALPTPPISTWPRGLAQRFSQGTGDTTLANGLVQKALTEEGFLLSKTWVETIDSGSKTIVLTVKLGERCRWVSLTTDNIPEEYLRRAGLRAFPGSWFRASAYTKAAQSITAAAAQNGYPFADLQLTALQLRSDSLSAQLSLLLGPQIIFDSIKIVGGKRFSRRLAERVLRLSIGEPFDYALWQSADERLRALPYITLQRPSELQFVGRRAIPILYIKDRQASQLDGVLGLYPNSTATGSSASAQRLALSGELTLGLNNAFGQGEGVNFSYRSLQPLTSDLRVSTAFPYLFKQGFGPDLAFDFYRRDTTYIELAAIFGLTYTYARGTYVKIAYQTRSSSAIGTQFAGNVGDNPVQNVGAGLYGVEAGLRKTNDPLLPTRGGLGKVSAYAGQRRSTAPSSSDTSQAQPPEITQNQLRFEIAAELYLRPLQKNSKLIVVPSILARGVFSPNLFQNERLRLGGLRTLRGFEEESILCTAFGMGLLETRYLLDSATYVFGFYNQAVIQDAATQSASDLQTLLGFGAGLAFKTGNGIFTVMYALGQQPPNPIQFRAARIHLGYRYAL